jgi:glutathione S-transferase
MAATKANPIIFYDLADANHSSWSPNPYKTRYVLPKVLYAHYLIYGCIPLRLCLNYKGLPYHTEYISFPDIEPRMKELGVEPVSNTFPYYTLPGGYSLDIMAINDPSSDPNSKPTYVSESFKIAIYLDEKYPAPQYPAIFLPGTPSIQHLLINQYFPAVTNSIVLVVSPKVVQLLDPQSLEYLKRTRAEMFKAPLEDDIDKKRQDAQEKLFVMGKSLEFRDGNGLFIMGDQVSFIDFAVGGWFHLIQRAEPAWLREILEWQDGRWGNFWEHVQKIETNSSEISRS